MHTTLHKVSVAQTDLISAITMNFILLGRKGGICTHSTLNISSVFLGIIPVMLEQEVFGPIAYCNKLPNQGVCFLYLHPCFDFLQCIWHVTSSCIGIFGEWSHLTLSALLPIHDSFLTFPLSGRFLVPSAGFSTCPAYFTYTWFAWGLSVKNSFC